jgi:hypothetical protein
VFSWGEYGTPYGVQQVDNAMDATAGEIAAKLKAMQTF